jgi:hypothetical protein
MNIREALISMQPSLTLVRAAGDEIARLDSKLLDSAAREREQIAKIDELLLMVATLELEVACLKN